MVASTVGRLLTRARAGVLGLRLDHVFEKVAILGLDVSAVGVGHGAHQ